MVAVMAGGFTPFDRRDRNAALVLLGLIWTGILMGFVPDAMRHVATHARPYPLIVHFHAAAFVGWLLFLSTQIMLVRTGNTAVHRRLGVFGAGLAAIMLVLGPATALTVQHVDFGTKASDPPFLSVQLLGITTFAILVAAGLLLRRDAAAHKRLMLLGTLFISDAGFARWLGDGLTKLLGDGFWPFWTESYIGNDVVLLVFVAYDLITRRRLHPVFVAGAALGLADQLIASWLYYAPWWKPVAVTLIGH
jgi:uncharacterized membrane protein YozB (DUF420 family)